MTQIVVGLLLVATGALVGIAVDRARLRRWIRSQYAELTNRPDNSTGGTTGNTTGASTSELTGNTKGTTTAGTTGASTSELTGNTKSATTSKLTDNTTGASTSELTGNTKSATTAGTTGASTSELTGNTKSATTAGTTGASTGELTGNTKGATTAGTTGASTGELTGNTKGATTAGTTGASTSELTGNTKGATTGGTTGEWTGGTTSGRPSSLRQAVQAANRRAAHAEQEHAAVVTCMARVESSLEILRTGFVVCDSEGTIVVCNQTATTLLQARHGEALVAQLIKDLLEKARNGEQAMTTIELRSEPRRSYEVEARPVERSGQMLGAVALVRDITEQHHNAAVRRDFVANVSHELKTPIGALSLLAESLTTDPDPEVKARLTGRIQIEIQRVANTIDDLLMLASLEGQSEPTDELIKIGTVIDGALERISETARQRDIELRVNLEEPSQAVRGSRVELESALFNLLDNAVKFSEPDSPVGVSVTRDKQRLLISITDQGIGIPADERSRIFERFYRVDRARSRHTGGTGLGLSIVRHVAVRHGGEVSVTSREGYGTSFTICLPLAAEQQASDQEP